MQNKRALLISLLAAIFGVLLVFSYVSQKEKSLMQWVTPIKVVVALKDIPQGTKLDDTMVEEIEIPKKYVQPGAMEKVSEVIGRTISIPVLKRTQILESVIMHTQRLSIAEKIPDKEMRAFSIAVTNVTAVAGLILPGDYVDVLLTVEAGSYKNGRSVSEEIITKTILQNIKVLAVNQNSSRVNLKPLADRRGELSGNVFSRIDRTEAGGEKVATLTFALTPEDVQKINMAQEIGSLAVSLRYKYDDGKIANIPKLTSQQFLGIKKAIVPRSQPSWVEIRGAEQIQR